MKAMASEEESFLFEKAKDVQSSKQSTKSVRKHLNLGAYLTENTRTIKIKEPKKFEFKRRPSRVDSFNSRYSKNSEDI